MHYFPFFNRSALPFLRGARGDRQVLKITVDHFSNILLEEIYRIREEHAKAFNYDLQAICDALRQKQAASSRQMISTPLKRVRPPLD